MAERKRTLERLQLEPGLTSEELRQRLCGPNGTISPDRPDAVLADLRDKQIVHGNGAVPQRFFPLAPVHPNGLKTAHRIVVWKQQDA